MAFRALPVWGKALVVGGAAVGVGTVVTFGFIPYTREAYKILARIPEADEATVKRVEEGYRILQDAKNSHSLLKKHLTKPVMDKLKYRKTILGGTLWDVIQSGVKNLDSGCGVYAPDAESYTTFKELFDPIIEEYHGFGPKAKQPKTDLGEGKLDYFTPLDPKGKYILNDYLVMEQKVKTALQTMPDKELQGTYYPLLGMSKETQKQLIQDHFLFKEGDRFLQACNACRYWPKGRGIYHNKDKTFLVWVNEEDHMRIISMQNGGDVGTVLNRLNRAVKAIEAKVPFSRDERLGWLTFCPTNLGTTVRASVHIKLPKLSAKKDFKEICEKMNLQVRGIHGEHSESEGGVYDISNKQRMGFTEYEAVKQMYDGVKKLIEMEENLSKK